MLKNLNRENTTALIIISIFLISLSFIPLPPVYSCRGSGDVGNQPNQLPANEEHCSEVVTITSFLTSTIINTITNIQTITNTITQSII